MIVVADTAPLNYLIQIDQVQVLPKLYGRVVVPGAVIEELGHPSAPSSVRVWMAKPPEWLEIQKVRHLKTDPALKALDEGEREAILLALELHAHLLLIDERAGRQAAIRCSLRVAGTLAVLEQAAERGLLDFSKALQRLQKTNFRISADILEFFRSLTRKPRKKP